MSAPTKKYAQTKLGAFTKKIGYPDKWVDFSALSVTDGPYANNVMAVRRFEIARNIARLGKPTDRGLFGMTPPTVNAYYNPSNNEIVFPAGILQPPFFNPNADDAVNYGAIGAVIGHEMTHGFDDQGKQFDAAGQPARLVDARRLEELREPRAVHRRRVQQPRADPRRARQGRARPGRSDRRPRRSDHRVQSLRAHPASEGAQDDRRLHARAALLPVVRASLARGANRSGDPQPRASPTRTRIRSYA